MALASSSSLLQLEDLQENTNLSKLSRREQLQVAKECIEIGDNMMIIIIDDDNNNNQEEEEENDGRRSNNNNYTQAITILEKALKVQQSVLGKHHVQVGCTCSLIGTAYWLQNTFNISNHEHEHEGEEEITTVGSSQLLLKDALKYFLEARRIFYKNYEESRQIGADNRIASILKQMGHNLESIEKLQFIINRIGKHEVESDLWKLKGFPNQAKKELNKARACSMTLMNLIG